MARRFDYNSMFSNETAGMASGPGTCPEGERWDDGSQSCIPDGSGGTGECPEGYIRDGYGNCVPNPGSATPTVNTECPPGQSWDSVAGRCLDDCPIGYGRNGAGVCVEIWPGTANPSGTGGCGPGRRWDESQGRCVAATSTGGTTPNSGIPNNPNNPIPPLPTELENPYKDYEKELWELYKKLFGNSDVKAPYTPEVIARLEGKVKGISEITKASNKQALLANRAAMGATGKTGQAIRNINSQADQRVAQEAIDINHTAIRANYDSEVANITRKMQILDSQTQFAMALAGNAIQRQNIQYNYQIQRMQIQNQLEMLRLQLLTQLGGK